MGDTRQVIMPNGSEVRRMIRKDGDKTYIIYKGVLYNVKFSHEKEFMKNHFCEVYKVVEE